MWYTIKQFFKSKNSKDIKHLNYEIERIQNKLNNVYDEIAIFKKTATLKQTKLITRTPSYFFCDKSFEEAMDVYREEARKEGFRFCHKWQNRDETWVKD